MIDHLLEKHAAAKFTGDRKAMAMLEQEIAMAIQKQADVDLIGSADPDAVAQFHARVILYPGPRPKKARK